MQSQRKCSRYKNIFATKIIRRHKVSVITTRVQSLRECSCYENVIATNIQSLQKSSCYESVVATKMKLVQKCLAATKMYKVTTKILLVVMKINIITNNYNISRMWTQSQLVYNPMKTRLDSRQVRQAFNDDINLPVQLVHVQSFCVMTSTVPCVPVIRSRQDCRSPSPSTTATCREECSC